MNTNLSISKPNTIKNNPNFIKSFINNQGFNYDTSCLDLLFKNIQNIDNYIKKIGDFNFLVSSNPIYNPPQNVVVTNWDQYCPDRWTQINNGCQAPPDYTGPCNSGLTVAQCPPSSWAYVGWNGPFNATNLPGGQSGQICTAGWSTSMSQELAQSDCESNGGTWIDWDFGDHPYTCLNPNASTSPLSYFNGYTSGDKLAWSQSCDANWPNKTIQTPGFYTCQTGASLQDDIKNGIVVNVGNVQNYDLQQSLKLIFTSNLGIFPNFFAIDTDGAVYVSKGIDASVFTSKGTFEPKCPNNMKMTVYRIDEELLIIMNKCILVNKSINAGNNLTNDLEQKANNIIKNSLQKVMTTEPFDDYKKGVYVNTTDSIQNNLNQIVKNLASNYNLKAEIYNAQSETINKHQELVEGTNQKLNNQLNELKDVEDEIALKARMIELNEEQMKKENATKRVLIGFFIFLPFLVIPILLYGFGGSPYLAGGIAFLMLIGYIIYAIIVINRAEVKQFMKPVVKQATKYERAIQKYYDKEKKELGKELSEFVYGECKCPPEEEEEESPTPNYPKGKYVMKANGPFYYYDGSAPPQQIYPTPQGSLDFVVGRHIMSFPKEISQNLDKVKNPVEKQFFQLWLEMLAKKGISVNDPRFIKNLDIIDLQNVNNDIPPYWKHIKLPMVSELDTNVNIVCQRFDDIRTKTGSDAATFLTNTWNFYLGEEIPENVYQKWLKKINEVISQRGDVKNVYSEFTKYVMNTEKFKKKSMDKFMNEKLHQFVKLFNENIRLAEPTATQMRYFG